MKIFDIVRCGIFDSKINFPALKESEDRKIQYFEIEYVISADGVAFIGDKSRKLTPGTVLIRKPGEVCHTKLHFKNYYLSLDLPKNSDLYWFLSRCPSFFGNIPSNEYLEIFTSLFGHTEQYGISGDSELVSIDILRLFYCLKRDIAYNQADGTAPIVTEKLSKVIAYIDENLSEKLTLKTLSERFSYSPCYLQKKFKEATGKTPVEYVTEKRISLSKREIMLSNDTMSEIAYKCGFSSQSYFCYAFKRQVGISPNEYKKSVNKIYKL